MQLELKQFMIAMDYYILKFTLKNGKTVTFPYKDVIHLRQDF